MKLKPFNLERALAGDKVVCKNDCVKIIEIKKFDTLDQLIVLADVYLYGSSMKTVISYTIGGIYISNLHIPYDENIRNYDLLMAEEEQDKINLEVGKFYKNTKGEKVFVFSDDDVNSYYVIVGSKKLYIVEIYKNGHYCHNDLTESLDIMAEWND